jgi:alpha-1,3-glucan synthase
LNTSAASSTQVVSSIDVPEEPQHLSREIGRARFYLGDVEAESSAEEISQSSNASHSAPSPLQPEPIPRNSYLLPGETTISGILVAPEMMCKDQGMPSTENESRKSSQSVPQQASVFEDEPQVGEDIESSISMATIRGRQADTLSISSIVGMKTDFALQKVDPDFTDSRGDYYKAFEKNLDKLTGDTSVDQLCIEEFLIKSERDWYNQFRAAKLGLRPSANTSRTTLVRERSTAPSDRVTIASQTIDDQNTSDMDQWLLGDEYEPPTGLSLFMQYRIGDWPIYSFFLALGQIVAANSYQITLLSGTVGETAEKLYVTASIYLITSALWWMLFRSVKSIYVLTIPFLLYSLAFLLLGIAPFAHTALARGWIQNVATGIYTAASSSGSIYFALNFGDEGGAPVKTWVYRASIIQGTQQIYVCALWAWGDYMSSQLASGNPNGGIITASNTTMAAITIPISAFFLAIASAVYFGLPKYYRQSPGLVPSFYIAIFRRKIVVWFFIVVLIQNYFLSASTGRNWRYLWSSNYASVWQILCLVILFFIVIWTVLLLAFGRLSKDHSWILPLFAVGLGAPRWAQILFSCSGIGVYLPWAGSPLSSALVSRSLWLWLGTLDAIQGVGFGMILLQTLTRVHIAYTLIAAQILGGIATMAARATAPNRIGPGDAFPDFSTGFFPGLGKVWFWVGLVGQIVVCVGFFTFFRKEQLSKP